MKKALCLVLALVLAIAMTACGAGSTASKAATTAAATTAATTKAASTGTEVTVFAAASMTETLNKIATMYKKVAPDVTLTFNFDSSGTLKTQIQQGATCDLFISAAQKQMNQLDASTSGEANPDSLDFVEQGTRVNLLENKVVLVTPEANKKGIKDFDDMAAKLKSGDILLAMGNSDVPVGQYTQKILKYYGLDEKTLANAGNITYGSNVKEVTTQVTEGSVDCGIIYCTDAYSAKLKPLAYATSEMCGKVIYPAAIIKGSKNADAAKAFLKYLQTDDCMKVFEEVGFNKIAA